MKPLLFTLALLVPALPAAAQIPNTLLHSIPAPPAAQPGSQLGYCVAVDGAYAVVGAPFDDLLGTDVGFAKVFDSSTGALLFVLSHPGTPGGEKFGYSVAVSGSRVVVGAPETYSSAGSGSSAAGIVYVYDLSGATPSVPVLTLNNPTPESYDYFGASVSVSGNRVAVGAYGDNTGVNSAGSAYVYDLGSGTPTVPLATLNNPASADSDYFGWSVAISGTRTVVGALYDDTGTNGSGSAYVYDLLSGTPTVPVATLNNPIPAVGDEFGRSVSISGTRVAVGNPFDDPGASDAGSVCVYDLTSATPSVPVYTLTNPSPQDYDNFGWSVAVSGTRVVTGAYGDNTGAGDAGSAYVYNLSSGTPTVPVTTINNPTPATQDNFGWSVAISGTRLMAGANQDDTANTNAGSAYLYELSNGTPAVPVATVSAPSPTAGDNFGSSLAMSGTRVVAGVYLGDGGVSDAGNAYVYDLSGITPTVPVLALKNPTPATLDYFGRSVAISGVWAVIGAHYDDAGAGNAGSAYVYNLGGPTPTLPVLTLNNPSPATNAFFGEAVGISGTRIVIGAPESEPGVAGPGRAYVYDTASATPSVPTHTLDNPSPVNSDAFGWSVAISGTVAAVGAYGDDTGTIDAGSVYVYDLASATPTVPVITLNNPSPAASDRFGYAVAISGTRLAVGAYQDDAGGFDSGSVYVYDLAGGTPTVPVATLVNASTHGDYFGRSVAISGTRLVVGAIGNNTGATDAGRAYVYDVASATPTVPVAILNNPGPAFNDGFGFSVAIDGTSVAVGTPYDESPQTDKGSVYIYGPTSPLTDTDTDGLLDSWELTYWPTTAGHGPLDDHDKDGYVELLELALGLNPTLPSAGGLPPVINEGGYLSMTLTKQAGVSYEVQSAGSLLPGAFSPSTTTVLINNAGTLKVRDNVLISTGAARFMRLKVTVAP